MFYVLFLFHKERLVFTRGDFAKLTPDAPEFHLGSLALVYLM